MKLYNLLICFLIALWSGSATGARQQLRSDSLYSEGNRREGRYKYGYAVKQGETQFHHQRSLNGAVYGCYGFVDPRGKLFITHYLADMAGYRLVNMAYPDKKLLERIQSLGSAEHPIELQSLFPLECKPDGDIKVLQDTAALMKSSLSTAQSSTTEIFQESTLHNFETSATKTVHSSGNTIIDDVTTKADTVNQQRALIGSGKTSDLGRHAIKGQFGSFDHPGVIPVKVVYDSEDSSTASKGAAVKVTAEGTPSVESVQTESFDESKESDVKSTVAADNMSKPELLIIPADVINNDNESPEVEQQINEETLASDAGRTAAGVSSSSTLKSDLKVTAKEEVSFILKTENVVDGEKPLASGSTTKSQLNPEGMGVDNLENTENDERTTVKAIIKDENTLRSGDIAVVGGSLATGSTESQFNSVGMSVDNLKSTENVELSKLQGSLEDAKILKTENFAVDKGSLATGSVLQAESQHSTEGMSVEKAKNSGLKATGKPENIAEATVKDETRSAVSSENFAEEKGSLASRLDQQAVNQLGSERQGVLDSKNAENLDSRDLKATVKGEISSILSSENVEDMKGSLDIGSASLAESRNTENDKLSGFKAIISEEPSSVLRLENIADVEGSLASGSVLKTANQPASESQSVVDSGKTENFELSGLKATVKNVADVKESLNTNPAFNAEIQHRSQGMGIVVTENTEKFDLGRSKTLNRGLSQPSIVTNKDTAELKLHSIYEQQTIKTLDESTKMPAPATDSAKKSHSIFRGRVKYKHYAPLSEPTGLHGTKTSYSYNSDQYKADNRGSFKPSSIKASSGGGSGQSSSKSSTDAGVQGTQESSRRSNLSAMSGSSEGTQTSFKSNTDTRSSGQNRGNLRAKIESSPVFTELGQAIESSGGMLVESSSKVTTDAGIRGDQGSDRRSTASFKTGSSSGSGSTQSSLNTNTDARSSGQNGGNLRGSIGSFSVYSKPGKTIESSSSNLDQSYFKSTTDTEIRDEQGSDSRSTESLKLGSADATGSIQVSSELTAYTKGSGQNRGNLRGSTESSSVSSNPGQVVHSPGDNLVQSSFKSTAGSGIRGAQGSDSTQSSFKSTTDTRSSGQILGNLQGSIDSSSVSSKPDQAIESSSGSLDQPSVKLTIGAEILDEQGLDQKTTESFKSGSSDGIGSTQSSLKTTADTRLSGQSIGNLQGSIGSSSVATNPTQVIESSSGSLNQPSVKSIDDEEVRYEQGLDRKTTESFKSGSHDGTGSTQAFFKSVPVTESSGKNQRNLPGSIESSAVSTKEGQDIESSAGSFGQSTFKSTTALGMRDEQGSDSKFTEPYKAGSSDGTGSTQSSFKSTTGMESSGQNHGNLQGLIDSSSVSFKQVQVIESSSGKIDQPSFKSTTGAEIREEQETNGKSTVSFKSGSSSFQVNTDTRSSGQNLGSIQSSSSSVFTKPGHAIESSDSSLGQSSVKSSANSGVQEAQGSDRTSTNFIKSASSSGTGSTQLNTNTASGQNLGKFDGSVRISSESPKPGQALENPSGKLDQSSFKSTTGAKVRNEQRSNRKHSESFISGSYNGVRSTPSSFKSNTDTKSSSQNSRNLQGSAGSSSASSKPGEIIEISNGSLDQSSFKSTTGAGLRDTQESGRESTESYKSGASNGIGSASSSFESNTDTKSSGQNLGNIQRSIGNSSMSTKPDQVIESSDGSLSQSSVKSSTGAGMRDALGSDRRSAESFKSAPSAGTSSTQSNTNTASDQNLGNLQGLSRTSSESTKPGAYTIKNVQIGGNSMSAFHVTGQHLRNVLESDRKSENTQGSVGSSSVSVNTDSSNQFTLKSSTETGELKGKRLTPIRVSGVVKNQADVPGDIKKFFEEAFRSGSDVMQNNHRSISSSQTALKSSTAQAKSTSEIIQGQNEKLFDKVDRDAGALKSSTNTGSSGKIESTDSGSSSLLISFMGNTETGGKRLTSIRVSGHIRGDIQGPVRAPSEQFKSGGNNGESSSQLVLESPTVKVLSDTAGMMIKTDDSSLSSESVKGSTNLQQGSNVNPSVGFSVSSSKLMQDEPVQNSDGQDLEFVKKSSSEFTNTGGSTQIDDSANQSNYKSSSLEVEPALSVADSEKTGNSDQNAQRIRVASQSTPRQIPAIRVPEYVEQRIKTAGSTVPQQPSQEYAFIARSSQTSKPVESKITTVGNFGASVKQTAMDDSVVVKANDDDTLQSMIPKLPATPRPTTVGSSDSVNVAYSISSYTNKPPVNPRPTTAYRPSISNTYYQATTTTTTVKPEPPTRTTVGPSGDVYDEIEEDPQPLPAPVSASHPTQMSPQIPSITNPSSSSFSIQPSISSHCYEVVLQIPADAKQVILKTESSGFRVFGYGDPNNRVKLVQPGVYEVNVGATGAIRFEQYQNNPQQDIKKLQLDLAKGFNYGELVPTPANREVVDHRDPALNNPYLPLVTIERSRSVGSAEVVTVGEDPQELTMEQRALLNLVPSWKKVLLYY